MLKKFTNTIQSFFLILLIFVLVFLFTFRFTKVDVDGQEVQNGYLDLSSYDFERYNHSLNGMWKFNYESFEEATRDDYAYIPSSLCQNPNYSAKGYGTYKLRLDINPNFKAYSFKFMDIPCAYSFFVNGKLVASSGSIGENKGDEIAQIKPQSVIYVPDSDVLDISLKFSNFNHYKGGVWSPILIGTPENISFISRIELLKFAFLAGIFGFISFWSFNMFFLQSQKSIYMYLASIAFLCMIRLLFSREFWILELIPDMSFEIQYKIGYIASVIIFLIVFEAILGYFRQVLPKELKLFTRIALISYLAIIVFFPVAIYGKVVTIIGSSLIFFTILLCYFIFKEIKYKKEYVIILLGMVISCIIISADFLFVTHVILLNEYTHLFSLGILVFMICFFYVLTLDISSAFEGAKEQTNFKVSLLQSQIAPHFLHNSINTAICMIDTEPEQAKDLLIDFSNYLRMKFRSETQNPDKSISVKQELDVIHSYIALQKARFGDRIVVDYNIDPNSYFVRIPPLLVQPLVENAIAHNNSNHDIFISIEIYLSSQTLHILVKDNGPGISKLQIKNLLRGDFLESKGQNRNGLGLYASHHRLKMLYGRGLLISSSKSSGTSISIEIPIENK